MLYQKDRITMGEKIKVRKQERRVKSEASTSDAVLEQQSTGFLNGFLVRWLK